MCRLMAEAGLPRRIARNAHIAWLACLALFVLAAMASGQETVAAPVQAVLVQAPSAAPADVLVIWNGVPYRARLTAFAPAPPGPGPQPPPTPPAPPPGPKLTKLGEVARQVAEDSPEAFREGVGRVAQAYRLTASEAAGNVYTDPQTVVVTLNNRQRAAAGDQWALWQQAALQIGQALAGQPDAQTVPGLAKLLAEIAQGLEAVSP